LKSLEQEQAAIQAELADGSLYAKDGARAAQLAARSAAIDDELLATLERLDALGGL
jgi:ATP-binding cassette subfamily F protein uup